MTDTRIEVQLSGEHGYVWTREAVVRLRKDHHILGCLVGSGAKCRKEETSLPLLLSAEEMQVLLEEELIKVVFIPRLVLPPTQDILQKANKYDEQSFHQQIKELKKSKEASIRLYADRIYEGKSKRLERLKKKRNADGSSVDVTESLQNLTRDQVIEEEIAKIQPIKKEHQIIQLHTQDLWLQDTDKIEARFSFPKGERNKCRLETFRVLWKKGYFIGEGSKFGGDFLVYLGDPLKFHSSYIVICLERKSASLERSQDKVAKSRLGNQVGKTVLIAQLTVNSENTNDSNSMVQFTSIKRNDSKRQVQYYLSTNDQEDISVQHQNKVCDNQSDQPKDNTEIDNEKLIEEEMFVEEGFEDEL